MPPDPDNKKPDNFIDKTTLLKSAQPVKFKAVPFAKGYRVEVSVEFDPDNSMHLDRFAEIGSSYHKALIDFINNTIGTILNAELIKDETPIVIKKNNER